MENLNRTTAKLLQAELQADRSYEAPGVDWYVGPFPLEVPWPSIRSGVILKDGRKVCSTFMCEGDYWCVLASNWQHRMFCHDQ